MTVRKRKKVLRFRGTRWHGKGSKKKRRGKGSRGGKGMAGMWNHRKLMLLKINPKYFEERNKRLKPEAHGDVINLEGLETLALSTKNSKINLTELGYGKLLGSGRISTAVSVKVEKASKSAIEKIQKAGGSVELS